MTFSLTKNQMKYIFTPIKERTEHFFGLLYGINRENNEELHQNLLDNLDKQVIRANKSAAITLFLFGQKPREGLQFYVDYHGLNTITVKNLYFLSLITETLHQLSQGVIYSKFDMIAAFNCLRIAKRYKLKTAFCTRYGLFEYGVLSFGFCNSLASFQYYINDILRKCLDIFCSVYLDDILIYNNSLRENRQFIKIILKCLKSAGLFLDMRKSEFHITKVLYLEFIISIHSVKIDPAKIKTIIK